MFATATGRTGSAIVHVPYAEPVTSVVKFTKRKYADAVVQRGELRLSHVSTFRIYDGMLDGRSDPGEMIASSNVLDGEETLMSTDPALAGLMTVVRGGEVVPTELTIVGETFHRIESGLLFCASLEYSDKLFADMAEKFGAEAAYEITDVEEFAKRITQLLHDSDEVETDPALRVFYGEVDYYDDPSARSVKEMIVDPFRKPVAYAWQREYRFWIRPFESHDYIDVMSANLKELVRIVR